METKIKDTDLHKDAKCEESHKFTDGYCVGNRCARAREAREVRRESREARHAAFAAWLQANPNALV